MPDPSQADAADSAYRIQYLHMLDQSLGEAIAAAGRLGFSHVMLPPPWRHTPGGGRFAPASLETLAPELPFASLGALVAAAAAQGLGVLLDVQVNRLAPACGLGGALFGRPEAAALLDPRYCLDLHADTAAPATPEAAAALGAFWAGHLHIWATEGVAGFRLLGLDAMPAQAVGAFMDAVRKGAGAAALFAWTPGLSAETVAALQGQGLAGVFPSQPWWDWQAPWFWREVALLRRVAPLIGLPEAPDQAALFGAGHAPEAVPALYRRAATLAACLGSGWLAVQGCDRMAGAGLGAFIQALNRSRDAGGFAHGDLLLPAGSGGAVLALLRTDAPDRRFATKAVLAVVNTHATHAQAIDTALLWGPLGGRARQLQPILPDADCAALVPGTLILGAAEARMFSAVLTAPAAIAARVDETGAKAAAAAPRLAIEAVLPAVDNGAFPVKRIAGDMVSVTADVVFDGHDKIAVALRYRERASAEAGSADGGAWAEVRMRPLSNDRWQAEFPLLTLGRHEFVVAAWRDAFASLRDEIAKKHDAGVNITLELSEGVALVRAAAQGAAQAASTTAARDLAPQLTDIAALLADAPAAAQLETLMSPTVAALMAQADARPFTIESACMKVDAERLEARFASWYEVFPRSLSDDTSRHGTFRDVMRHLPRIRDMGFDVLYFPPIHPIGRMNRKGRNNSLTPAPGDPGSPYAIGGEAGGHDALHPHLGNFEDFSALREAAAAHGLELAMDFAVQCAPDHPWLREHKGWFDWRPDGSIKYAENPPKKYEDIVNVDFYAADAVPALWLELCRVVLFWAEHGVRLFRVDNPHTKPFPFWEWLIAEVRARHPDAIFLAEAFTRPKVMYRLAKIGFSQSYTYFTWRNTKRELQDYVTELADGPARDFFRPHFFVNTPDINPLFLQQSGRPGFLIRAALAATLSGLWGVYNGFELCEAAAVPGKEEYADSEKYQLRAWDWQRRGSIVAEITMLNRIRRDNPALQTHLGVQFHNAYNDAVLYFEKATADRANVVLVAVSLDPGQAQEADIEVPLWNWGLGDDASVRVENLLTGGIWVWHGKMQRVRLTPEQPYAIWRVQV